MEPSRRRHRNPNPTARQVQRTGPFTVDLPIKNCDLPIKIRLTIRNKGKFTHTHNLTTFKKKHMKGERA